MTLRRAAIEFRIPPVVFGKNTGIPRGIRYDSGFLCKRVQPSQSVCGTAAERGVLRPRIWPRRLLRDGVTLFTSICRCSAYLARDRYHGSSRECEELHLPGAQTRCCCRRGDELQGEIFNSEIFILFIVHFILIQGCYKFR